MKSSPLALQLSRLACDAIYHTQLPSTLAVRALAIVHTAMYDAWTAYTGGSYASTTTGIRLKRPEEEHTKENREIAFSYAAWRVMEALFADFVGEGIGRLIDMPEGCRVDDKTLDSSTPQGIGNLSAKLVLDSRNGDGSNPDEFSDYTNYQPVNPPPPERVVKVDRWQPQLDENKKPQKFLHPHWGLVKPFALECGMQFRPPEPVAHGSCRFEEQIDEVISISAELSDQEKLIAEYWAGMHEDKFADSPVTSDTKSGYYTIEKI